MTSGSVVVVGGTGGLGLEIARRYVDLGHEVFLTGRDRSRSEAAAAEVGAIGLAFDLALPETNSGGFIESGRRVVARYLQ